MSVLFGYRGIYIPKPHKTPQFLSTRPPSSPNSNAIMEESFRVRIDKVFGSLSSSTDASSSSSLNSLWCLTDEEIDRSDRSGEKVASDSEPQPSFPENVPEDLSVDEDEGRSTVSQKPDDYNDEEWEIKSSIGMDTTLDMEVC